MPHEEESKWATSRHDEWCTSTGCSEHRPVSLCAPLSGGVFMRLFPSSVLAALFCVLPLALGGDRARAAFECGVFDGKFQCRAAPGAAPQGKNASPGVNSATPEAPPPAQAPTDGSWQSSTTPPPDAGQSNQGGSWWGRKQETVNPGEHSCPPGYRVLATPGPNGYCEPPAGTAEATSTGCQRGMVGTPPNCHCPKNSDLLGGNCVHYTATCRTGLAADANPQACASAEERLACNTREDGLKDCCCLLYDKM